MKSRASARWAGFGCLADELAEFSRSLTEDTRQLTAHTEARKGVVEEAREVLSAELPILREQLTRVGSALDNDLAGLDSSLKQLSCAPAQFKHSLQEIAGQIAGVVAAIQSNDITRQQIEHVRHSLTILSSELSRHSAPKVGAGRELSTVHGGLTIQLYQLQSIQRTVGSWTSQIRRLGLEY